MNPQDLYDLAPVLQVMGTGLVVACGPLAWIWLRHRHAGVSLRLHRLTLLTLFLTFDLVLFGAFTRLTDSGLGCPDWPGCYGVAHPAAAQAQIHAAQEAMPSGPVTPAKAWIEMTHRYLAIGVSVLIIVLLVATVFEWRRRQGDASGHPITVVSPLWPLITLLWVCVQGAFGALTVTMKLFPAIVTLHLIGGLVLIALLVWQAARQDPEEPTRSRRPLPSALRFSVLCGLALVSIQVALGGWVSTNYAVLACDSFPTCQGDWWPRMDWSQAFALWRPLGLTAAGTPIDFSALTAIHYVHRLMAYLVFVALGVLSWRLQQLPIWRRTGQALAGLLILQGLTGLSNVILGWPLLGAVLHTGGAAALVMMLNWILAISPGAPPGDSHNPPLESTAA